MRKFSLYLSALFFCVAAKAQFTVAVVGGPQFTSVTPAFILHPDTVSKNPMKRSGVNLGFIAQLPVNKKQSLFFRTGVIYSQKGSKVQQQFDTSNVDIVAKQSLLQVTSDLSVNYIDAPLNLVYKLPIKGKTKFIIGAGLQASLFYNGKTNFSTVKIKKVHRDSAVQYEYKETIDEDLLVGKGEARYKTVHLSANALAGFEFGRVFLTANYSNALTSFYAANDQSFKFKTIGVNLGIFLGNRYVKKETAKAVIKDTDGDGIPDEQDACPALAGTALTKGCPDRDGDGIADKDDECPDVAGLLQYKGCPVIDTDGDGINDPEDKCPFIAGSKKYQGCPIPDTDNDGINDEEDQCPAIAGTKENNGCPQITKEEEEKVALAAKQIQFEFGKTELSPSSYAVLDEVVNVLKNNPSFKITIEGHTSGANSESNMKLSQKRAESVKIYFVSKGIIVDRITAIGYGSTRPLKPDSQKENPEDRRVELIIL
jgi:OmpA-OmpF porin, OOP family